MPVMQEIRPEGKETKTERSADVARIISLGRGFIQSAVPSANVVLDSEFAKYAPLFQSEVLKTMDSDKAKALYEEYKGRFSLQHPVKVVTRQVPGPNDVGAYYAPLNQNLRVVRVLPPVYRQMRTLNEAGPEACRLIDAFLNTSKSNDVHSKTKNRMYAAEIANIIRSVNRDAQNEKDQVILEYNKLNAQVAASAKAEAEAAKQSEQQEQAPSEPKQPETPPPSDETSHMFDTIDW